MRVIGVRHLQEGRSRNSLSLHRTWFYNDDSVRCKVTVKGFCMNVKSNRRGRWNVVDVLIILFVATVIMALGYVMLFADGNLLDRVDVDGDTKTVLYTFEVAPVHDDLLVDGNQLPIEKGDVLYHLTKKFSLGEVVYVGEKTPYMVLNDRKTEMVPSSHQGSFTIKVKAQAVVDEGIYYVNDHVIRIGEQLSFSTPYFTGVCKCVALEEVTDGE